jgi:heme/copper-type cytochrome/quinol oxidase subunit 2
LCNVTLDMPWAMLEVAELAASETRAREHSGRIELVVWSIPALAVILLGGVAWIGAHQLYPAKAVEGPDELLTANLNHNMMPMDQIMQMQRQRSFAD